MTPDHEPVETFEQPQEPSYEETEAGFDAGEGESDKEPAAARPAMDEGEAPEDPEKDDRDEERDARPKREELFSGDQLEVFAGRMEGSQQVAHTIFNENHVHEGDRGGSFRHLKRNDFASLTWNQLESALEPCVFRDREIDGLVAVLRETRCLLIVGNPEMGKGTIASRVAQELWRTTGSEVREVLRTSSLEQDIRVDLLRELGREPSPYQSCCVIFEDVLDRGNTDLADFLSELDEAVQRSLEVLLETRQAYLILTSSPRSLPEDLRAVPRSILREVEGPDLAALQSFFIRQARSRLVLAEELARRRLDAFLEEQSERLVEELGTGPRVQRFLETGLPDVLQDNCTLEEALARLDDRSDWLLRETAKDPALWSFVLALCLALAAPKPKSIPWFQFYPFWRRLDAFLREQLRRRAGRRSVDQLGVDEGLLRRARAEITHGEFPSPDRIRFVREEDSERLWRVLLGSGRGVLALLAPFLESVRTEAMVGDPHFYLREISSRALGRIGEIDPGYLVRPKIVEGMRSQESIQWVALGEICQGILGSGDRSYRDGCLAWLRSAARQERNMGAEVTCLREMGVYDLDRSMSHLYDAVFSRLDKDLRNTAQFDHRLRSVLGQEIELEEESEVRATYQDLLFQAVRRQRSARSRDSKEPQASVADRMLSSILRQALKGNIEVMDGACYGLAGLCFAVEPIQVLARLGLWLQANEGALAVLTVVSFLHPNGVAARLQRQQVVLPELSDDTESPTTCSRILLELALGQRAVQTLGDFLCNVYVHVERLPGPIYRYMRDRFLEVLTGWAAEVAAHETVRQPFEELLSGLLTWGSEDLKSELFHHLQDAPEFAEPDSDMRRLAVAALSRRPRRAWMQVTS